jgi:hypothetical protein
MFRNLLEFFTNHQSDWLVRRKASNWSAQRILKDYKEHDWSQMKEEDETTPVYFLGELVWLLDACIKACCINTVVGSP